MRLFGEIHTVDYIPTVQYLPGKLSAKNKIAKNREEMQKFYREVIDEHKKTYDAAINRDLIDVYIAEIENAKEEGRITELFDGKDHGKHNFTIIFQLFTISTNFFFHQLL